MKHYFTPDPEDQQRAELAAILHPTALELRRVVHATLTELRETASRLLDTDRRPPPRRRRPPKK
jgi:hypothetical protein